MRFRGCSNLKSVVLGTGVESIGRRAFVGCTALAELVSHAVTPPKCGGSAFEDGIDMQNCVLLVPEESLDLYKAADPWKDFVSIQAATEVESLVTDNGTDNLARVLRMPVTVYTLSGQKLTPAIRANSAEEALCGQSSGIYILRGTDGAACKVMKK